MPHDTPFDNSPQGMVRRWKAELALAHKEERNWRDRAKKIVKRYRDEDERADTRFNILWSNTETLKPALFSNTPEPDVRRRYKDEDPLGREVALTLERAIAYSVDSYDFDGTISKVVLDHLLTGRGVARVRYVPTIQQREAPSVTVQADTEREMLMADLGEGPVEIPADSVQQTPDGQLIYQPDPYEEVTYEEARCEYVNWDDFRMSPARTWSEVRWIAFRHRMTREQLKATFGDEVGQDVQLDHAPQDSGSESESDTEAIQKRATVWEIWHKEDKEVVFIAEGYPDQPLDVREDPLQLGNFFPVPKPLYSMETNSTMVPVPEYTLYQDQADELNRVTHRIDKLVEALKVRGLYAGEHSDEISRLLSGDDNELIPSRDFAALMDRGGLDHNIAWMPIEQIARALQQLYAQRDQLIQTIYQITGISDIMRGSTDPNETRGAQEIKAQFGSLRLKPRQRAVQHFVRELFRFKAEIMAEQFDAKTLQLMTGTKVPEKALELMRDDGLRGFRIDVETDSTVANEEKQDKQEVTQMFQALSGLLQQVIPAVEQGVFSMEAAKELVKFGMRRFKVSRQVEEVLDQMGEQPPQQQGPDPVEMAKLQQKERQSQRDFQLEILKLKKEYAQLDADELQTVLEQSVELASKQEQPFRDAFRKITDAQVNAEQKERAEPGEQLQGVQ